MIVCLVSHQRPMGSLLLVVVGLTAIQAGRAWGQAGGAGPAVVVQPSQDTATAAPRVGPGQPTPSADNDRQSAEGFTAIGWERSEKSTKGDDDVNERSVSNQAAFRTGVITMHPVPQLRHATATYEPIWLDTRAGAMHAKIGVTAVPSPFEFEQSSLNDVVATIENTFEVDVSLDAKALEALDPAEPMFTERFLGGTLRSALRQLLGACDLDYVVTERGLKIMTSEAAAGLTFPVAYPIPAGITGQELMDLLTSVVQPTAWDVQGGPGGCRWLPGRNLLVVSQTQRVHEEIEEMFRGLEAVSGQNNVEVVAHAIRDPKTLVDLEAGLADICNAALGQVADSTAKVTVIGGRLVVQSRSRPFQVYASEVIQAVNGVDVPTVELATIDQQGQVTFSNGRADYQAIQNGVFFNSGAFPLQPGVGSGGGFGGGGICWVAREVYGAANPNWLRFRQWLQADAPGWLVTVYATYGESFAAYIRQRPVLKSFVRGAMDQAIAAVRSPRPSPDGAGPPSRP